MSWYRLYRPQTVAGLHLKSVRQALAAMLKSGSIPHALLFAGPKGTGKTSSARIIARVLNCEKNINKKAGEALEEPCGTCGMCQALSNGSSLNVIEIDGASNRRIDDVRQLQQTIYLPPAMGKKAVYIVDEVHMLTKEAFNALLKTLEEPPEHALFIFATTDPQQLPATIVSRCVLVRFQRASIEELADALVQIGKKEKVEIHPSAMELIAQAADGSFRDAVKLFEQQAHAWSGQALTIELVQGSISAVSSSEISQLIQSIVSADEKAVVQFFNQKMSQQVDARSLQRQILEALHAQLHNAILGNAGEWSQPILTYLLRQFQQVQIFPQHPMPLLGLELCALEMVLKSKEKRKTSTAGSPQPVSRPTQVKEAVSVKKNETLVPDVVVQIEPEIIVETVERSTPTISDEVLVHGQALAEKWADLLSTVHKRNMSLGAILRSAKFIAGEEGTAKIQVFYQFHKEQLELSRYRQIIDQSIQELLGGTVRCEFILESNPSVDSNVANVTEPKQDEFVNTIEEALL